VRRQSASTSRFLRELTIGASQSNELHAQFRLARVVFGSALAQHKAESKQFPTACTAFSLDLDLHAGKQH